MFQIHPHQSLIHKSTSQSVDKQINKHKTKKHKISKYARDLHILRDRAALEITFYKRLIHQHLSVIPLSWLFLGWQITRLHDQHHRDEVTTWSRMRGSEHQQVVWIDITTDNVHYITSRLNKTSHTIPLTLCNKSTSQCITCIYTSTLQINLFTRTTLVNNNNRMKSCTTNTHTHKHTHVRTHW